MIIGMHGAVERPFQKLLTFSKRLGCNFPWHGYVNRALGWWLGWIISEGMQSPSCKRCEKRFAPLVYNRVDVLFRRAGEDTDAAATAIAAKEPLISWTPCAHDIHACCRRARNERINSWIICHCAIDTNNKTK